VLLAAGPVMDELVKKTCLDTVLSTLFEDRVVDIHRASGDPTLRLSYGRGRPMPLFLGAAAKILVSHLGRRHLQRIYEAHVQEVQSLGLGASWSDFRIRMHAIHAEGFYLSLGEVESNVGAAAVPLFDMDGEPAAALALVGLTEALAAIGEKQLRTLLRKAQDDVRLALSTRSTPPPATENVSRLHSARL
jgi:DNA-binding IclR family transcriptional regulator